MEPSATSTTVTGPVGQRLQAGPEDTPVLHRPAPLRRLHDSFPDIHMHTYFLTANFQKILASWVGYGQDYWLVFNFSF